MNSFVIVSWFIFLSGKSDPPVGSSSSVLTIMHSAGILKSIDLGEWQIIRVGIGLPIREAK